MHHHLRPGGYHSTLVSYLKDQRRLKLANQLHVTEAELQSAKEEEYKETSKLFALVYLEIKLNIPYKRHGMLADFITSVGGRIGQHYHTYNGARDIAASISELMHKTLVSHLKLEAPPFGLMVDSLTTREGTHYLGILQQIMEGGRLTNY